MSRTLDTPIHQAFYQFTNKTWEPVIPDGTTTITNATNQPSPLETLRLTTWNIDFRAPCPDKRMTKALQYLSTLHIPTKETPSIIFLHEITPSDLHIIQKTTWIRNQFYITDLSHENWRSQYGTTALIDRRFDVRSVFRVLYSMSRMGRDALFIDVRIHGNIKSHDQRGEDGTGKTESSILRLCNTHLESLTSNPPIRPVQLRLAAQFMRGSGPARTDPVSGRKDSELPVPHAAILAGDLNAFAPEDETAPEECGLLDAFLELGGKEGSEEGFTWGQQMADYKRSKFGCSRMDKVLFCGGLEVQSLEKIGAGEKVWIEYPQESDSEESSETGEDLWVTDHIGLQAVFRIVR
ncbi:endonuclease/exonuclease/phosphatase family protein [Aspergillus melleus]|uniref:endonuclease/exonuclease/phosphatase family protein n=1 Tax=Aspergillus melleus TaxID=138277 RepID=UPI001E8E82C9|nr:uncharacterized protein LDX57_005101 [Aspergillus melleus]KAH8427389.1 hypothetical protein LDX57_005101 [Aspergillus melleus]